MAPRFIVGLDIGTASIKVAVAEKRGGKLLLHAVFREPSLGLRRGVITDLGDASETLARAFFEIKKISKSAAKNIYASIGTPQVKVQTSRGIVAVSRADTEIYQEDVDRVIRASQAVNLPPNRMIVHHIPREYIVDGIGDIIDPLGLSGSRLEVVSLIMDVFAPHVKDMIKVVELNGGEIKDLVLAPLVAAQSGLSKRQRELGTVLVSIGAGTTSMAVYEDDKLLGVAVFPVGAAHVTNDIAIGLKVPVESAEAIKLQYGYALAREVMPRDFVELKELAPSLKGTVARRFVSEIIESRLAEILEFVNNELKSLGKAGELPGGAVVVGGGAKLPGITELTRQELKLSGQIGSVLGDMFLPAHASLSEFVEDPEFVVALGLLRWGFEKESGESKRSFRGSPLRRLIRYFLP